jgi:hypothetical protein
MVESIEGRRSFQTRPPRSTSKTATVTLNNGPVRAPCVEDRILEGVEQTNCQEFDLAAFA